MKTRIIFGVLILVFAPLASHAQIDPEPRRILHLGHSHSLHNDGPNASYVFYYWNTPDFPRTNQTLRMAIAPVYVDGELGFEGVLGEHTDVGVGLAAGGFANSYDEVRRGDYIRKESFNGHGGGPNASIYHLFNPAGTIPLNGMIRGGLDYNLFTDDSDTDDHFDVPEDQGFLYSRVGLRYGGAEPVLFPTLAFELSAWYEMQYRTDSGRYGYNGDRRMQPSSHQLWARARLNYTLPELHHYIGVNLSGGSVLDADRFSAFRLGGSLPFTSEFPLFLPGYFHNELSAENFGLLYGVYGVPFGPKEQWFAGVLGGVAIVDYVDDLKQPGDFHSGVGGLVGYQPENHRYQAKLGYGYGVDAMRSDGRGGHNLMLAFQYNFGATKFAGDRAFDKLEASRNSRMRIK